jgi:two-component system NtrC family sensor kinase
VSRSWRIRHKLMLGLALAIGVLALLLSGTLRGLWSYYVTTDSIRGKLKELKAAEDFKETVTRLTFPFLLERPPGAPPPGPKEYKEYVTRLTPQDGWNYLLDNPSSPKARNAFKEVRQKLSEYEFPLDDNLTQGRGGTLGAHRQGQAQALVGLITRFEKCVNEVAGVRSRKAPVNPAEDEELVAAFKDLAETAGQLSETAQDLQNDIHDDLNDSLSETRRHYQVSLWIIVPTSVGGLVLLLGLMRSFYTWIMYPIRDLNSGVARVAAGDFAHRIEINSGDEMQDLSSAFNDMTGHLQTLYGDLARQVNERSRQLVRSERLASVGFLAAGVAHEINNPLASIAFCSEALEARLAELLRQVPAGARSGDELDVFQRYLKMIQEEAFRCKNITERLLSFSRTREFHREPTDLARLVQSVLDVTQHLQNCKGKDIVFERPPGRINAPVNAEEIKSVILNLVVNALDSMDDGGQLVIRLSQVNRQAELSFLDTGCGMTQEVLDNIFEPFFTQSRTGKGTGLGLTISHRIVTQHGGDIEATSAGLGRGSTFTVRLPLDAPAQQSAAA